MFANWHTFKHGNVDTPEESEQRMSSGFFGALPPTMFVLMPIFALRLKIFYAFQRRLYVEHLIVALHSHAFLLLNLLLGIFHDAGHRGQTARCMAGHAIGLDWPGFVAVDAGLLIDYAEKGLSVGLADNDLEISGGRLVLRLAAAVRAGHCFCTGVWLTEILQVGPTLRHPACIPPMATAIRVLHSVIKLSSAVTAPRQYGEQQVTRLYKSLKIVINFQ